MSRPRVVVRLSGGLGNQLFQYAAGRAAAIARDGELELDARSFARDRLRTSALDGWPIEASRRDLSGWRRAVAEAPGLWRLARRTGFAPRVGDTRFLFDRLRGFDERIRTATPTLVLTGYWQDERYFQEHEAALRRELSPDRVASPEARAAAAEVAREPTIGIHVRRGDFADVTSVHGTCPVDYYRQAAEFLCETFTCAPIVVVSDDPDWCRESLDLARPFRIEHGKSPADDLHLLASCRALALSNSSFSWWAAWLAEGRHGRAGTLVVCPSSWYRAEAGPIPHPAPHRWKRLAVSAPA